MALFVLAAITTGPMPPPPPPPPPPPKWDRDMRIFPLFHGPFATFETLGYAGDANGMMWRANADGGHFHLFWQCVTSPRGALSWCHSASRDFVRWIPLGVAISGGAESGGAAQLSNGDSKMAPREQARRSSAAFPHRLLSVASLCARPQVTSSRFSTKSARGRQRHHR